MRTTHQGGWRKVILLSGRPHWRTWWCVPAWGSGFRAPRGARRPARATGRREGVRGRGPARSPSAPGLRWSSGRSLGGERGGRSGRPLPPWPARGADRPGTPAREAAVRKVVVGCGGGRAARAVRRRCALRTWRSAASTAGASPGGRRWAWRRVPRSPRRSPRTHRRQGRGLPAGRCRRGGRRRVRHGFRAEAGGGGPDPPAASWRLTHVLIGGEGGVRRIAFARPRPVTRLTARRRPREEPAGAGRLCFVW